MAKNYAHIRDNTAIYVFSPQEGYTIEESLHPDFAALFVEVPSQVEPYWWRDEEGNWFPPV